MLNERAFVLSQASHCSFCKQAMPNARYGQRYCDSVCRAEGRAQEQRAAHRLWREMGRPSIEEQEERQGRER
jgi:hypothetical protein